MDLRNLLSDALAEADRLALQQSLPKASFQFGDLSLSVRIHGAGRLQQLTSMIGARAAALGESPALIDVVGLDFDHHCNLLPPVDKRGKTLLRANDDIYYLWLNEAQGYLTAIDRRTAHGLVWFTAPDKVASWHVARPFLHAIQGLSFKTPWTPIHAAGVALNGRAVLIVGQSGAGKSSIAMNCVRQGWDYLGDDAVIVRAEPARVAALYNSARLREDTFARFPDIMAGCLRVSDDAGELKAEIDMSLLKPLKVGEAEIAAIVVPQPTDWTDLRLKPMGRSETLRRLMVAAAQSIIGDEPATFAKLAALVKSVPCYSLVAGGDATQLSRALAQLTERRSAA